MYDVITPPAQEPLTVAQVKTYLAITYSDYDAVIGSFITAAREHLENKVDQALITQTIRQVSGLPEITQAPLTGVIVGSNGSEAYSYRVELDMRPLQSVTSVEIETQIGTWAALTLTDDYLVDTATKPASIYLSVAALALWSVALNYPGSKPRIRITYVAGYGSTGASAPGKLLLNLYQIIAWLWQHKETDTDIPDTLISSTNRLSRL